MRINLLAAACGTCAALLAPSAAHADPVFFDFLLGGDQEVAPVETDAFGFATLTYDTLGMTFDIQVFTSGIALSDLLGVGPNGSPIHIHAAPRGSNGPIVIDLGLSGTFVDEGDGLLSFTAFGVDIGGPQGGLPASDPQANLAALFAGGLYLNIHTVAFPSGEIRGQIVPTPSSLALLGVAGLAAARRRRV